MQAPITSFLARGLAVALGLLAACSSDDGGGKTATPANVTVRARVAELAPAAVFAHRGLGPTRSGNPFPESSLSSFQAALGQGADALETDAEITLDGQLILMHDDTVDRTTDCTGCVSALSFDAIRQCNLLDGDGQPTDEIPPTVDELFALAPEVLVNIELKVFGGACLTPGHGPVELATAMVEELRRLGVEDRTIVQSFDTEALATVKAQAPEIYTALLVSGLLARHIDMALDIEADALQPGGPFPLINLSPALIAAAREAGLQVIPWTVNDAESINKVLDAGVDGIITDDPALVRDIVEGARG